MKKGENTMKVLFGLCTIGPECEVIMKAGHGKGSAAIKNVNTGQEKIIMIPFMEIGVDEAQNQEEELTLLKKECYKLIDDILEEAAQKE